ncbi:MAG: dihydropteroate synthase [Natronomonas sp.]
MEYHEAASRLFGLRRYGIRPGVEPTRRLLEDLGEPQTELRVVQIAGSNGKGSTARMLESILREAGYDVGLYTSPHLDDVRERIRIDGRMVSKQAVTEFFEAVEPAVSRPAEKPPTFFEATTALAVWAFARAGVDVAVLEVGLGGRLDATSAVDADAAAVTNVTVEHEDVLGDTVAEIAGEKASVAPGSRPLVTAATGTALSVLEAETDLHRVGDDPACDTVVTDRGRDGIEQVVDISGDGWNTSTRLSLLGRHQCHNAGVAAALARQIGADDGTDGSEIDDEATVSETDDETAVSESDIARGLHNAGWPGRFEVMGREPLVVLDGAHNPGACEAVASTLSTFDAEDCHLVFGAMCDKDHAAMADRLSDVDRAYLCRAESDRAEEPSVLAGPFESVGVDTVEHERVEAALSAATEAADPTDAVVVTGSLSVVAEARQRWTRRVVHRRLPDREAATSMLDQIDVSVDRREAIADDAVRRTVTTRLRPQTAARLEGTFGKVGGTVAVSDIGGEDELLDVVLSGTLSQFEELVASSGETSVVETVRKQLDTEATRTTGSAYPWQEPETAVMGILNVTPDSFHDGGRYNTLSDAVEQATAMVDAGADIVDVGGESTRPGADPVPVEAEIDRVVPVVEAVVDTDALVSIDTRKAPVAEAALDAGADILNDVSGLEDPEMRHVAAAYDVPVVVMHSIETPVDPDVDTEYDDVVTDTLDALTERVLLAEKAGLDREQIIVDPGIGFGKSATESFELLDRLGEFRSLGCPVLVGHSRKSLFGLLGEEDSEERLSATVAATALAAERGADIVRVHDVAENVAAVQTAAATADPDRLDEE